MNEAAPLSLRTLLFGTFAAIVAFCFFEHTAWLVLAVCVLIGYCGRAYVHQSQPEIAQMQMHDMVDHTPLHSQSSDTGSNSTGMVKEGSSVDKSQRLGAPAQSGSVGIPSERPQDTAVARMPSGNTSSEQLLKGSTRAKAAPDTQMPDPDFTFPAISPLQPMQHMDPMQVPLHIPLMGLFRSIAYSPTVGRQLSIQSIRLPVRHWHSGAIIRHPRHPRFRV